jgi:hypothetical protein
MQEFSTRAATSNPSASFSSVANISDGNPGTYCTMAANGYYTFQTSSLTPTYIGITAYAACTLSFEFGYLAYEWQSNNVWVVDVPSEHIVTYGWTNPPDDTVWGVIEDYWTEEQGHYDDQGGYVWNYYTITGAKNNQSFAAGERKLYAITSTAHEGWEWKFSAVSGTPQVTELELLTDYASNPQISGGGLL